MTSMDLQPTLKFMVDKRQFCANKMAQSKYGTSTWYEWRGAFNAYSTAVSELQKLLVVQQQEVTPTPTPAPTPTTTKATFGGGTFG